MKSPMQLVAGCRDIRPFDVQLFAVLEKSRTGVELGDLHHGLVFPLGPFQHLVFASVRIAGEVPPRR